jgi:hypothetical protein
MHKRRTSGLAGAWVPIALLSMAALFLEVSLTHFFSVIFYPPAVFAVLSLAVLGIGLGAALAAWRAPFRQTSRVPGYLFLASLSVLVFSGLAVVGLTSWVRYLLWVLVVLPYFFAGLSFAVIFSHSAAESPRLYQADLTGAGVGAILAMPLLNQLGGLKGVVFAALLLAAAGVLAQRQQELRSYRFTFALALGLLLAGLVLRSLDLPMPLAGVEKPASENLATNPTSRLIRSHWDAFARSDLIDPGDGGAYRLYTNGAAGSIMPPAENNEYLWRDIGFFPFATEQPQRVFIAGPGGGLDVWFALQAEASQIVAVEVNPASVALVKEYAAYNGNLYNQPGVEVHVDEARSFLRRQGGLYDLIFLSQVVTLSAERNGYTLVENGAYTIEAFQEYLDHLAPDGQLGLKLYDEPTLTRALATALTVFNRQGLSDQQALQHMLILLDAQAQPPIPLLLVKKSPISEEAALSSGAVARQVGFTPLFLPGVFADPPLDQVQAGMATFTEIISTLPGDYSATTDGRPFFYEFERGLPSDLRNLAGGMLVILVGFVLFLLRLQRPVPRGAWMPPAIYFAMLGLGFMLVEIAFLQQVRLFLGHPTLAITVVLATLLIGGGVGSGLADYFVRPTWQALPILPALGTILVLGVWSFAWPWLSDRFLGLESGLRVLVVVLTLLPVSMLMGISFPLGLRAVERLGRRQVALAWSINGVMTVAGSILAMVSAVEFGYTMVLFAGGLAYALAASAAALSRRVLPASSQGSDQPSSQNNTQYWEQTLPQSGETH